eukprot:6361817-Pyramimonas_sp.AAC.1
MACSRTRVPNDPDPAALQCGRRVGCPRAVSALSPGVPPSRCRVADRRCNGGIELRRRGVVMMASISSWILALVSS